MRYDPAFPLPRGTPWEEFVGRVREELLEGWEAAGRARARLAAAVAHALQFQTWRSLARAEGLGDAETADLMAALAQAAAAPLQAPEPTAKPAGALHDA